MDSNENGDQPQASGDDSARTGADAVWTDAAGQAWGVSVEPERIMLSRGDERTEFPASRWPSDIYVAAHGSGYIVRFSTFEQEIGFVVSSQQAESLIRRLGALDAKQADEAPATEDAAPDRGPLLWPKVSSLAVWALITSACAFVPIIGIPPAIATVVLLILHRKRVRRARAWDHSRAVCTAAFIFLIAGLVVSIPATLWLFDGDSGARDAADGVYRGDEEVRRPVTQKEAKASSVVAQSVLEQEHNWGMIAAGLLVILMSLSVHEAAHAITAWWLGDDLARRLGRVTLSPLAHIDPIGTLLLPLILFMAGQAVFGWARPVPVQMEGLPRWRRAHILVSLAGPGSNLLMASASLILLLGGAYILEAVAPSATVANYSTFDFFDGVTVEGVAGAKVIGAVLTVLKLSFLINTLLAFFNLIPIPPLDGSWVLEHLFPRTFGPIYSRLRSFGILLFIILIYTGVFQYLIFPAIVAIGFGVAVLRWCTPF